MSKDFHILMGQVHYIKMTDAEYNSFSPIKVGTILELTTKIKDVPSQTITEEVLSVYSGDGYKVICIANPGIPFHINFDASVKVVPKMTAPKRWLE